MICYRCGTEVGKAERCPACGARLTAFRKAKQLSNAYYNDGLQKAEVRNLSGAVISLKTCLKFNKYNIEGRNLLGLIYYEMGETVDALSEWVISKSYQAEDNRADYYLRNIQNNPNQLNAVNQTIKKYNQALLYCRQDSRDLAIIQLKKVLSLNPKLVKGHQLLALLYMQDGRYEAAKKSLRNAGKIDTDNTTTLRYLKEVNARLRENTNKKKDPNDELISYQSGNETIIMPKRFKESSLGSTMLSIIIGLVVGVAATTWLIVPNVKKTALSDTNKKLLSANDTISTNNQTIKSLEEEITTLNGQIEDLQNSSLDVEAKVNTYEQLLAAYDAYNSQDVTKAGETISEVDATDLSTDAKQIYDSLKEQINVNYLASLYNEGYSAYNKADYETAITKLKEVIEQEEDYEGGTCAYYLAQAYRKNGDLDSAKPYYQYVVDNYPGTQRARTAKNYVD